MVAASCVWAAEPPDQAAETNSVHAVSEQRAENPERPVAQSEVEDTPVTQQRAPLEPGKKLTLQQKRIFVLGLESNSMP